jgi:membrane protein implicated in regulation of membrane protease activity
MAINRPSVFRSIDFAIVAISLVVIGTALGCLVFITTGYAAAEKDPNVHRYLARLSWIALTLLLFVVVVFAWVVVRYVSLRLRQRSKLAEPTTYLDAWALAGKRFKLSAKDEQDLADLEIKEPHSDDEAE